MLSRGQFIKLNAKFFYSSLILDKTRWLQISPFRGLLENDTNVKLQSFNFNILDSLNNYVIIQNDDPNHLQIVAYEFVFDQPLKVPDNKHLSIFSFRLIVSSDIELNAKNIFLFTNELISINGRVLLNCKDQGRPFSEVVVTSTTGHVAAPGSPIAVSGTNRNSKGQQEDLYPDGPMNAKSSGDGYFSFLSYSGQLTIKSIGADGGQGQSGQPGRSGDNASNIHYASLLTHPWKPPCRIYVFVGFAAESGGDGALGGYGGKGGNLKIATPKNNLTASGSHFDKINDITFAGVQSFTQLNSNISFNTVGGCQGASGVGGNAGLTSGLDAWGIAGQCEEQGYQGQRPVSSAPPAHNGFSPPNTHARDGHPGSIVFTAEEDYYKYVTIDFAKLLMLKAESFYLMNTGDQTAQAAQIFKYIENLACHKSGIGYAQPNSQPEIQKYLFYCQRESYNQNTWDQLKLKATSYLSQMDLGLDLFGNKPGYAPNLDPNYLLSKYKDIVIYADGFEEYAVSTLEKQQQIAIDETQRSVVKQQYIKNIAQIELDIKNSVGLILEINNELQLRFATIEDLKNTLQSDDQAFQQAVADSTGGCSLTNVLKLVTAVVGVVAAIVSMGAAAGAAVAGVASLVQGLQAVNSIENLKTAISSEGIITQGISDLSKAQSLGSEGINKFKDAYKTLSNTNVTTSLLSVDRDKFDKAIDQYLDLPTAVKYKEDFHNFCNYCDLTNQKRVQITSLIIQISTNYHNKELQRQQLNDLINADLSDTQKSLSLSSKQAIVDLYFKVKVGLIKLIYQQYKAIQYQDPSGFYANMIDTDQSLQTLTAQLFVNNYQLIDRLNSRSFHPAANKTPFKITKKDNSNAFKVFVQGSTDPKLKTKIYSLKYKIRTVQLVNEDSDSVAHINYLRSIFANIKNIKVMGVLANFNSEENIKEELQYNLEHVGDSNITTLENFQGVRSFNHIKQTATALTANFKKNPGRKQFSDNDQTNLVGQAFGTGDKCYLGVSPFATWRLTINENENPEFKAGQIENILKKINSVELFFYYYYEPI